MVTSELRWPQQRLLEEKHLTDYVSGTLAVQREHSVQCVCLSGCPEINDIWSRYLERWFNSEFDGPGHMRKMLLSCQCDFERGLSIVCDHLQLSTDKVDYAESCSYGQRVTTDSMLSGLHMNGDRRYGGRPSSVAVNYWTDRCRYGEANWPRGPLCVRGQWDITRRNRGHPGRLPNGAEPCPFFKLRTWSRLGSHTNN